MAATRRLGRPASARRSAAAGVGAAAGPRAVHQRGPGAALAGARAAAAAAPHARAPRQSAGAVARPFGERDRGPDRVLFLGRKPSVVVGARGPIRARVIGLAPGGVGGVSISQGEAAARRGRGLQYGGLLPQQAGGAAEQRCGRQRHSGRDRAARPERGFRPERDPGPRRDGGGLACKPAAPGGGASRSARSIRSRSSSSCSKASNS
jgi:hypothetical protein